MYLIRLLSKRKIYSVISTGCISGYVQIWSETMSTLHFEFSYEVDFLYVVTHALKFQIHSIVSNGCSQGMLKCFKTTSQLYLKNELKLEVCGWACIDAFIWFSPFKCVLSETPVYVKNNFQYWSMMLIFPYR